MDIFKSFTFTWWEASTFKLGMAAVGILLGVYFTSFFKKLKPLLWIVAILALGYITLVWLGIIKTWIG